MTDQQTDQQTDQPADQPARQTPPLSPETRRIAGYLMNKGHAALAMRQAADRVAAAVAPLEPFGFPWFAGLDPDEDDQYRIYLQPTPIYPGADVLMSGAYVAENIGGNTARWIERVGPQIAGALVMTLRAGAAALDAGTMLPADLVSGLVCLSVELLHQEDNPDE